MYGARHLTSLFLVLNRLLNRSINKTLASYLAAKIMRFHLYVDMETCAASERSDCVNSLFKFATSHHVEELSLVLNTFCYAFPDSFFRNSSLRQLIVDARLFNKMIPRCTVTWTSLRNLSLNRSVLTDESFPKIISGSPMLENLTLQYCGSLRCLDLSESLHLRRLDLEFTNSAPGKLHIVAPHIHYLRLIDFRAGCSLADVPSLTEANIEISYFIPRFWCIQVDPSDELDNPTKDYYQVLVQAMLEKLQNVENLTVGLSFLQEKRVNRYLDPQDVIFPVSLQSNVAKPHLVALFMELLLVNSRTLETLVVQSGSYLNRSSLDELSQMAHTVSHNNKVSIVLK